MGFLDRLFGRRRAEPTVDAPGLFTAKSGSVPPTLARPEDDAPYEPEPELEAEPELERDLETEPPAAPAPEVVAADPPTVEEPPPWEVAPDPAGWEDVAPVEEPPVEDAPTAGPAAHVVDVDEDLFGAYESPMPEGRPVPAASAPEPEPEPEPELEPLFGAGTAPPEPVVEPAPEPLVEHVPEPVVEHAPAATEDIETVDDEGRRVRVHDGRLDRRPGPIRMTPSEAIALAEEGPQALRRRHPDH